MFWEDITFWTAIGAIGTTAALIFAVVQIKAMRAQTKFDADWKRKEKAASLALFYASEIIPRVRYVTEVYESANLGSILRGISKSSIKEFTLSELKELTYSNVSNDINDAIKGTPSGVFERSRAYLPDNCKISIPLTANDEEKKSYYMREYFAVIADMLNSLEYFSMCLNCDIADKKLLYQSLHQSFFATVNLYYFEIAKPNHNIEDRYYTHIARLYFDWLKEYEGKRQHAKEKLLDDYSSIEI